MKKDRPIKALTYFTGFFVISAALLLSVFFLLTALGLLNPRQEKLIVRTPNISKTYDGAPLEGTPPEITYGQLRDGHILEVLEVARHTQVGVYENAPQFRIMDESGADVTKQYAIEAHYGSFTVHPREIILYSPEKSKVYDSTPLTADAVILRGGSLVPGHTLEAEPGSSIILPGTEAIRPVYRILSETGEDVTDQYEICELLGKLTVTAIPITVATESAQKVYDGQSLSAKGWSHTAGQLLEGHTLEMAVTSQLKNVGTADNEGVGRVLDQDGKDVSNLYRFIYQFGTLEVQPIPLYIKTMSSQMVYNGTALSCPEWELTGGDLEPGAVIQMKDYPAQTNVGTVDNIIHFTVTDAQGKDISDRYHLQCTYGTLSIQPRPISIRTGSAEKVYDGLPLSCDSFEIIQGSLCENDRIQITGISITNVGYSQNYAVDCTVYRIAPDGTATDVSSCYRISIDFGILQITAN